MSRQDANAAFARTSFLYGGNGAYIEDLYARYETDPNSVDAEWRAFFESLKDNAADVTRIGGLCLQALLSAQATWADAGWIRVVPSFAADIVAH